MVEKSTSQQHHKKKRAIKKILTPNKDSPAMATRSKALVLLLVWPWELGARKDLIFDQFTYV
jgi:hypothetical protein